VQAAQKDLPGNGMLEYWSVGTLGIKSIIPLSIVPIFRQLLRCGEAIDGSMGLTMSGMAHIKLFLSRSS
jgi:hypothetical protein